jgi:hypothetical protein
VLLNKSNLGVRSAKKKARDGLDLKESNIYRGFPADRLRHINQSKNYWKLEGPKRETGCHLPPQDRMQGSNRGGVGGGPGGHGRRRSGHRWAELGHKIERVDRDEHDGGLTSGGGRRDRLAFQVNGRRRFWRKAGGGGSRWPRARARGARVK